MPRELPGLKIKPIKPTPGLKTMLTFLSILAWIVLAVNAITAGVVYSGLIEGVALDIIPTAIGMLVGVLSLIILRQGLKGHRGLLRFIRHFFSFLCLVLILGAGYALFTLLFGANKEVLSESFSSGWEIPPVEAFGYELEMPFPIPWWPLPILAFLVMHWTVREIESAESLSEWEYATDIREREQIYQETELIGEALRPGLEPSERTLEEMEHRTEQRRAILERRKRSRARNAGVMLTLFILVVAATVAVVFLLNTR